MKIGKISEMVLTHSVLKQLGTPREEVLEGAGIGQDFALLQWEGSIVGASAVQVCCRTEDAAFAVVRAVNNLLCSGGKAAGVFCTALLPPSLGTEEWKLIMESVHQACIRENIQILGGHTETTGAVEKPVVTITGIGTLAKGQKKSEKKLKPGQDLVMTKWIGLEGTALLARHKEKELLKRYPYALLKTAQEFTKYLSVQDEARAANHFGSVVLHDVSQGGILTALWEIAERSGTGLEVDFKQIAIRQETVEISEHIGVNPYSMPSSGALLIGTDNGYGLARELEKQHIKAAVIGKVTDKKERVLQNGEEIRFLDRPKPENFEQFLEIF
ncbi:MAG: AIR synthase-related protein, partial [Oscillospiraceae bacterium]|nr:AIR synthase-related protein [Oscillospiraceae bacterium]